MGRSGGAAKRRLSSVKTTSRAKRAESQADKATRGGESPPSISNSLQDDPFMGLSLDDLRNAILNNPEINEMFDGILDQIPKTFKDPVEERLAKYILLEAIAMSGEPLEEVFGFDPLEEMRKSLPREVEYAPQAVAWHCLRETLPLLDEEGASKSERIFKEFLEKEYSDDLEKGIWQMSEENLDHAELLRICGLITSLRVSRNDPVAQRIENFIEKNLEDINKRSEVSGRVGQRPLVISFDVFSADYKFDVFRGVSISNIPGADLQIIPAKPSNDPAKAEKDVRGVVVHEIIHGGQKGKTVFGTATMMVTRIPKGWDEDTSIQLLEAMTEGLTLVRCKESQSIKESIGVDIEKRHYAKEVAALYTILTKDCNVSPENIPTYLEKLNDTMLDQVPQLLESWGCRDVLGRFSSLLKSANPKTTEEIWLKVPVFQSN